jgi:hypothetical protein
VLSKFHLKALSWSWGLKNPQFAILLAFYIFFIEISTKIQDGRQNWFHFWKIKRFFWDFYIEKISISYRRLFIRKFTFAIWVFPDMTSICLIDFFYSAFSKNSSFAWDFKRNITKSDYIWPYLISKSLCFTLAYLTFFDLLLLLSVGTNFFPKNIKS